MTGVAKKSISEADPDAIVKAYFSYYELEGKQIPQSEAGYNPAGMTDGKACASCNWFMGEYNACALVAGTIMPTGLSNYYMPMRVPTVEPVPVIIVAGGDSVQVKSKAQNLPLIGKFLGEGDEYPSPITLFKDNKGDLRFFCRPSNCFRDREKEILTSVAHKEYAEWVTNTGAYPSLQLWHTPAATVGQVDWVEFDNNFLCASGKVFPEYAEVVTKAVQLGAGMSHGFIPVYNPNDQREMVKYRSFEFTILPVNYAANVWTDFNWLEWSEKEMAFSPQKRKYFTDLGFSDEQIIKFESDNSKMSDAVKSTGAEFKEVSEAGLVPQLQEITQAITSLAGTVETIAAAQKAQGEQYKELNEKIDTKIKSVDEQVAEHFKAAAAPNPGGFSASSSKETVDEEATKKLKEQEGAADDPQAFFNMIRQQAAAAGLGTPVGVPAGFGGGN